MDRRALLAALAAAPLAAAPLARAQDFGRRRRPDGPIPIQGPCASPAGAALPRPSTTVHVSPQGDDGGDGSATRPLRTIQAAVQRIGPGVAVLVHAGTYAEAVKMPSKRGGAAGAPFQILSADGPAPRGSRRLIRSRPRSRGWASPGSPSPVSRSRAARTGCSSAKPAATSAPSAPTSSCATAESGAWRRTGSRSATLAGGAGNNTYYVEVSGEKVVETAGGGYDTVYVNNGAWSLGAGQEVEKLVAAAGTAGIALHGNAFAQTLVGNDGSILFDGGGGADTMIGGGGNDVYFVENNGDVIVETAGGGTDYVQASVNYALSANVEYLTLTAAGHTGKGNDTANTIVGTSGSDTLIGAGGADSLTGGGGADVFTYQHLADRGDVITDFQVGVDRLNVHDLLVELGGGAHLSFAHTAKGLEVYVDHGAAGHAETPRHLAGS